ncbi:MAG: hypothetical protein QOH72_3661, partial [Solirubrobacteraceae bacterium]|nr:hypothetical protein [Solirubrobacteraceae bacterium]
ANIGERVEESGDLALGDRNGRSV